MQDKQRNQILTVLFIGVLMGALDIAIVGPALPAIREQFAGINEKTLSWIFSIYVLFNLISTPIMARLSDLFGRRIIYVLDVTLFAIGSLLVAAAPSFVIVLVGRGIQGFGAGGIFPVASAVIGDTFPPEKRGSALGLIGAVFGIAFIIGPILGGLLLGLGWQWLFLINLPVAVIVILLSLRLLPSTRNKPAGAFDWAGMATLAVMLASLAYGLNQIDTQNFLPSLVSLNVLPFLLIAVVLGLLLAQIEKRVADPILNPALFRMRQLRLGYMLSAGAGLGEASLVFMPLLAVAALGVSDRQASFLLMPVVIAMSVGSPLVGRLLDRVGSRVVILTGTLLLPVGLFILSRGSDSLALFIIAGALIGLGLSTLLGAPIRYITLNEISAGQRSIAQGMLTVFASVGQLIGAATMGGVAYTRGGGVQGYASAFLMATVVSVFMIGAALILKKRKAELATIEAQKAEAASANMPEGVETA